MTIHTQPSPITGASTDRDVSLAGQPPAIDLVHLSRQTMGDKNLELELLGLFAKQAQAIVTGLDAPDAGAEPRRTADLLHTLCGSARAVGCWAVAAEAQRLENGLVRPGETRAGPGGNRFAPLRSSVDEACSAIGDLLGERD